MIERTESSLWHNPANDAAGVASSAERNVAARADPALLLDDDLHVVASSATVAATPGAALAATLRELARAEPTSSLALQFARIDDADFDGWLVEPLAAWAPLNRMEPAEAGVRSTEDVARRLASTNLKLQEEVQRRGSIERQMLSVAEGEKQRISLELHDGLGQHLTGVSFVARSLAERLHAANRAEAAEADWLVRLLNEAIARTRALARGLWPVSLERDSLSDSIRKLADDLESLYGVSCAVKVIDEPRIPSHFTAHHVFRIMQEAATNAVKHGRARRLTFQFEAVGDAFTFSVLNDGLPIDPELLDGGQGIGVFGMRLRADALGGQLSIEPLPAGGAEVTLTLPDLGRQMQLDVQTDGNKE
ncbi:MAG TPA: ATP-binding protein [Burkholderiaceae bacterium]|nr:ATP-binding protein [Burkholderiaceae bacterium]